VRNRLQRGLARLRERFDRELGGPDERRRVFLAWLALPHAGAVPRLAVRLAQRTAIAGLLLVLGAVAVLRWRAAGATAAPEIDARTSSASAHATHVSPAPALAAGREPVVATVATRLGDGLAGTVVDELGAPVEGALVTVASPTRFETEPVAIGVATHTDATGAFALPRELAPRTGLVLFAEKAGHVPARAELLHDSTRIVLRTAATFTGLVVDAESDAPLAGVRITFHEHDWSDGAMRETRTDAAGRFSVARVPSGVLSFALARPGDAFQARRLFVPRDGAHDVRIALARGASIQGRVVDGDTGAGLADARIVVDFADVVRSAGDGSFALAGVEPAERHDVEVRLAGHCSVVLALEDGAPLDEPLVLPIWRECAVEGVVRDGAGAAQPFAEVSLHDDRALAGPALPPGVRVGSLLWQAHSTLADEHGRFRIDRLAPWRSFEIVARVRGQRAFGRVELAGPASRRHAAGRERSSDWPGAGER
jgi:hypothetical protein